MHWIRNVLEKVLKKASIVLKASLIERNQKYFIKSSETCAKFPKTNSLIKWAVMSDPHIILKYDFIRIIDSQYLSNWTRPSALIVYNCPGRQTVRCKAKCWEWDWGEEKRKVWIASKNVFPILNGKIGGKFGERKSVLH